MAATAWRGFPGGSFTDPPLNLSPLTEVGQDLEPPMKIHLHGRTSRPGPRGALYRRVALRAACGLSGVPPVKSNYVLMCVTFEFVFSTLQACR